MLESRVWKLITSTQNTYILKPSPVYTGSLKYALETDSVYCKKAGLAIATPNSQNSYIKSLVFMVLKGYLFYKKCL